MKKVGLFILIHGFWLLVSGFYTHVYAQEETIQILTYYPEPYAVYKNIKSTQDTYFATESGNVGIGTTEPGDKLHVVRRDVGGEGLTVGNGTLRTRIVINSNIWPELRYQVADTEYWRLGVSHQTGSYGVNLGDWYIYDFSTNQMAFILRNDNGGTILSPNGGNVGIGTTSPNAKLSINGSIFHEPSINPSSGTTNTHVKLGSDSATGPGSYCTVSGGLYNSAGYNYATTGGGRDNYASGSCTTVGGGNHNVASFEYSTVVGGVSNNAYGYYATVVGGELNKATSDNSQRATIGGGDTNVFTYYNFSGYIHRSHYATIIGGYDNKACRQYATIWGGSNNKTEANSTDTSFGHTTIGGGYQNEAIGTYSFALGRRAKAKNPGCFVWADSTDADYSSNSAYQFRIRASGGVFFGDEQKWDIAEFMDVIKKEEVSECDIVSIKSNDILGKSVKPYDENLVGVVSSKKIGTLFLGEENTTYNNTVRMPITLAGRAYVKVNNENGQISIGDPITSSSQAGIGMRATKSGKVIGYAMEELDFKENKSENKILVFINICYYFSDEEYKKMKTRIKELEKRLALYESY